MTLNYFLVEAIHVGPTYGRQYSLPDYIQDDRTVQNIITTIEKDPELTKIASEDAQPLEDSPEGYTKKTAADFWSRFAQVNPELHQQLTQSFKQIVNYKVVAITSRNPEQDAFATFDRAKQAETNLPSFAEYVRNKNPQGTVMKQTPVSHSV